MTFFPLAWWRKYQVKSPSTYLFRLSMFIEKEFFLGFISDMVILIPISNEPRSLENKIENCTAQLRTNCDNNFTHTSNTV